MLVSIGLLVDFVMHMLLRFYESTATNRVDKVKDAVQTMGSSILLGGISTFLGVLPLAISTSEIFQNLFICFLAMVVLGVTHGLILLPVVLSLVGPNSSGRNLRKIIADEFVNSVDCSVKSDKQESNTEDHSVDTNDLEKLQAYTNDNDLNSSVKKEKQDSSIEHHYYVERKDLEKLQAHRNDNDLDNSVKCEKQDSHTDDHSVEGKDFEKFQACRNDNDLNSSVKNERQYSHTEDHSVDGKDSEKFQTYGKDDVSNTIIEMQTKNGVELLWSKKRLFE